MEIAAFAIAIVAVFLALIALAAAGSVSQKLDKK